MPTPTPKTKLPTVKGLSAAMQEAIKQRSKEETGTTDLANPQVHLDDKCPRNAYVLAKYLDNHGFNPTIICGGRINESVGPNGVPRSRLPTTIKECRDRGMVHYWVETELRTYTLDMSAQGPEDHPLQREPYIDQSVPPNYFYLEDGLDYTFDPVPK